MKKNDHVHFDLKFDHYCWLSRFARDRNWAVTVFDINASGLDRGSGMRLVLFGDLVDPDPFWRSGGITERKFA
jgi:hypothetical protein